VKGNIVDGLSSDGVMIWLRGGKMKTQLSDRESDQY
jgi:hypothetical protein